MTILDVTNREMRLGAISPSKKVSSGDEAPSDSIWHVALAGWLIIAIFFGGRSSRSKETARASSISTAVS